MKTVVLFAFLSLLVGVLELWKAAAFDVLLHKSYSHMFDPDDTTWKKRNCLITMKGQEYVGFMSTPLTPDGATTFKCRTWQEIADPYVFLEENKYVPLFRGLDRRELEMKPFADK